jgi:hypothetical protein
MDHNLSSHLSDRSLALETLKIPLVAGYCYLLFRFFYLFSSFFCEITSQESRVGARKIREVALEIIRENFLNIN